MGVRHMKWRVGRMAATVLMAAGLTAGCTPGTSARPGTPAYQVLKPPALQPGAAIPAPRGEVVLSLSGAIGSTNSGGELTFDLATIEQLGLIEYTVNDPWRKETVTYAGVLLSDLLKYAGTSSTAKTVEIVALDDYQEELTLENIRKWPILLATRSDGDGMSVADGGPTRVIFPIHAYDIDSTYESQWVWSVKTISVK